MFTCEVYDKVFTAKRNLMVHVSSAHNGVKFTCKLCLKSFTRKYKLDQHKKIAHRDSVIQYALSAIIEQPATVVRSPTSETWDDTVEDDAFLEAINSFENQG